MKTEDTSGCEASHLTTYSAASSRGWTPSGTYRAISGREAQSCLVQRLWIRGDDAEWRDEPEAPSEGTPLQTGEGGQVDEHC